MGRWRCSARGNPVLAERIPGSGDGDRRDRPGTSTARHNCERDTEPEVNPMMQAVVIHGREDYRLERVPVPVPGPGEALVKVQAVGICASDLKCFHGAPMYWGDGPVPPN